MRELLEANEIDEGHYGVHGPSARKYEQTCI